MSIFGIAKKGFGMLKKSKSKTSPTITSVKPNKSDKMSKHKVDLAKIPGATANRWKKSMDDLDETGKVVRKIYSKIKKRKTYHIMKR